VIQRSARLTDKGRFAGGLVELECKTSGRKGIYLGPFAPHPDGIFVFFSRQEESGFTGN